MSYTTQLPQHNSTSRLQNQAPACPRQPSSPHLPGLRSQLQRNDTASRPDRRHRQQLRQLRQVVLNAVRADQQGQQTDSSTLQLISEITSRVDEAHNSLLERSSRADGYVDPGADSELKSKVYKSIESLSAGLLERETEVRLLLLAALCGEHLVMLGPPGTAKSELARRLSGLTSGTYFERLLTRFSVPEELFGPLSMRGLENDLYERQIDGYLPTAEVAFVDEIFKANSAILNALLTLLNERLFDNGSKRIDVPLLCLVGASNELPESEELDALYDRFLLRRSVSQVSAAQLTTLARLAAGRAGPPPVSNASSNGAGPMPASAPGLAIEDFRGTRAASREAVDVPDGVIDLLTDLRNWLQDKAEPPIYISDRRFMKSIQLLQVAAFADGRDEVNAFDCLLLEFVYGNRPDDAQKVRQRVLDIISSDPGLQQTELVFLGLFGRACRVLESPESQEVAEVQQEVTDLVQLLTSRQGELASMLNGFPQLRSTIWFSEASQQAAVQSLTPQMTENRGKVEDLLREAMLLQEAVTQRIAASALEKLLPRRFKQYQKGIGSRA
ncbi:hypothetical protein WJX74_009470 [Apatococcus lobatus]|uniref:AAA+ ATPase domain-containing protein n=1 Tax=Apatococcus lobatus TaxID=904363 RepID=A0AAW1RB60_9CHLO